MSPRPYWCPECWAYYVPPPLGRLRDAWRSWSWGDRCLFVGAVLLALLGLHFFFIDKWDREIQQQRHARGHTGERRLREEIIP